MENNMKTVIIILLSSDEIVIDKIVRHLGKYNAMYCIIYLFLVK